MLSYAFEILDPNCFGTYQTHPKVYGTPPTSSMLWKSRNQQIVFGRSLGQHWGYETNNKLWNHPRIWDISCLSKKTLADGLVHWRPSHDAQAIHERIKSEIGCMKPEKRLWSRFWSDTSNCRELQTSEVPPFDFGVFDGKQKVPNPGQAPKVGCRTCFVAAVVCSTLRPAGLRVVIKIEHIQLYPNWWWFHEISTNTPLNGLSKCGLSGTIRMD